MQNVSRPEAAMAITEAIRASPAGWIPFSDFMHLALHAPEIGYYAAADPAPPDVPAAIDDPDAAPSTRVGRRGDFFTSVSVGDCFGFLLARVVHELWESLGRPEAFHLIEVGAHDATLSRDIVEGLAEWGSPLADRLRLVLVDPALGRLKTGSEPLLRAAPGRVEFAAGLTELASVRRACGMVLANELLDALPVRRLRLTNGRWLERGVALAESGRLGARFAWSDREIDEPRVNAAAAALGTSGFPDGYLTEIHPAACDWITKAARLVDRGLHLLFDYGFAARDFHDPSRTEGTLRTYQNHRVDAREAAALENPGARDITADVNFTAVAEAAEAAGLSLAGFCDQHHFLVRTAEPWLRDLEENPAALQDARPRLRQFQTLTHPALMGRSFKVLGLARDLDPAHIPRALAPYTDRRLLFDAPPS